MYRCLIATLGRDAPGVNAAIRAVTRIASQSQGWKVYAARRGFSGILNKQISEISEKDVRFIIDKGGSLLGSSVVPIEMSDTATLERLGAMLRGFDLVVGIGGLGSFSVLNQLYAAASMQGTTTNFIPASIENEFLFANQDHESLHALSIGADTAANTGTSIVDRLREQSYLNQTVFLVQTVGMKSNFLPLSIGLACGAHRIYLPEYPVIGKEKLEEVRKLFGRQFIPNRIVIQELVGWLKELFFELKKTHAVVILPSNIRVIAVPGHEGGAAEGDYEKMLRSLESPDFSLLRLVDDLSVHFADSPSVQIRSVILDDLQRGGPPGAQDRLLGSLYGEAAVEEYLEIINSQDSSRHGNLNLLAVHDVYRATWESYPRDRVAALFKEKEGRPGGLDPLPFYRQSLGLLSGYRKLAQLG